MDTLHEKGTADVLIVYTQTTIAFGYLLFSIVSYSMIFLKFWKSKQQIVSEQLPLIRAFRQSKFYTSIVLVISSLLLSVIPLLVYTISRSLRVHLSANVTLYIDSSLLLSDTVDAVVYVFLYQPVRESMTSSYRRIFQRGRTSQGVVAQCVVGGQIALCSVLSTDGRKYIKECIVKTTSL